jgi:hypothetical protein
LLKEFLEYTGQTDQPARGTGAGRSGRGQ